MKKLQLFAPVFLLAMCLTARADVTDNVVFPINVPIPNDCSGEVVDFTGSFRVVFAATPDGKGCFHIVSHANASQVKGVGRLSGAQYVGAEADAFNLNFNASGSTTVDAPSSFAMIGKGRVPDFRIKTILHITVDANGRVTATTDRYEIVCR